MRLKRNFNWLVLGCAVFCTFTVHAQSPKILRLGFSNNAEAKALKTSIPTSIATDSNRLLINALKNYYVKPLYMPSARAEILLQQDTAFCLSNRLKTPQREAKYLYTKPINIYMGLRLYYRHDHKIPTDAIDKNGKLISLVALFNRHTKRKLLVLSGRSFGQTLDAQISRINKRNLVTRAGMDEEAASMAMLGRGRIDYLIEYPPDIKMALSRFTPSLQLKSIALADATDYVVGYITCSKTTMGEKIVEDINRALTQLYKTAAFYQAHKYHLGQSDIADFDVIYHKVFQHKPGQNEPQFAP